MVSKFNFSLRASHGKKYLYFSNSITKFERLQCTSYFRKRQSMTKKSNMKNPLQRE